MVLAAGCAESTSTSNAVRTANETSSANTTVAPAGIRERSIVELTDAAVEKFTEFLSGEPGKHIRLSVKNEGPTGFMHDLQIDGSLNDGDYVDRSHGFALVVDPKSSIYLDGTTIDWQTRSDGSAGFQFNNPNAVEP